MRTAIICLAYLRDTFGVDLLQRYFEKADADLFLHVDAKSDSREYESWAADKPNVTLLPNRWPIWWGGFNTVRALIDGLQVAMASGDYHRFALITEDSIPVVPVDRFVQLMASDVEYLEKWQVSDGNNLARYTDFYYLDCAATSPRTADFVQRRITAEDSHGIMRMEALRTRGKLPLDRLMKGSTWCALTRHSVEKIIEVHNGNDWLRESFEFSAIPEEQYFHTILGDLRETKSFMYTDWTKPQKPLIYHTGSQISASDCGHMPFIRKIAFGDETIREFVSRLCV